MLQQNYTNLFASCRKVYTNWHSSTILTEGFPVLFISCKENARVLLAKKGHGLHYSQLVVNCVVPCVVNCVVLLLIVLFYC